MTVSFVTGTDTGVGKTVVTAALAVILRARRKNVHGIAIGSWPAEPGPVELYNRHDLASHVGVPSSEPSRGASALPPPDFQARAPGWIQTDSRPAERGVSGGAMA